MNSRRYFVLIAFMLAVLLLHFAEIEVLLAGVEQDQSIQHEFLDITCNETVAATSRRRIDSGWQPNYESSSSQFCLVVLCFRLPFNQNTEKEGGGYACTVRLKILGNEIIKIAGKISVVHGL